MYLPGKTPSAPSECGLIEQLMACVEDMEGKLCRCGKGKGKEIVEVVPSVLGSPLVLDLPLEEDNNSDDSYHTPPIAGRPKSSFHLYLCPIGVRSSTHR